MHTDLAPHPASTAAAAASAPLPAGPVLVVTADPGSVDAHEQPSFQQDDVLGAAWPELTRDNALSCLRDFNFALLSSVVAESVTVQQKTSAICRARHLGTL